MFFYLYLPKAKHISKGVSSLRLIEGLLSALIVLAALVRVREDLVGCVDLLEIPQSLFISRVLIRMVLE